MSGNKSIIVKKVKKQHGGGHHGGAWKVAYADFVTAMMAFFLLLWLLSMTSDEKRARISSYFKYFSIYDSGGTSWMEKSSEIFGESGENKQKVFTEKKGQIISNSENSNPPLTNIGKAMEKDISEKLGDLKDQVIIDAVDQGIRIQMTDKNGSLMFERGGTTLTAKAQEVLQVISSNINKYKERVIIEGHTDSLPYAGSTYSNWELSTERASSARIALEAAGLDPKRIARVAGYADTDPLIKDNPMDPKNRRISITLHVPNKVSAKNALLDKKQSQMQEVSRELMNIVDKVKGQEIRKSSSTGVVTPAIHNDKKKPAQISTDRHVIKTESASPALPVSKTNIAVPEDTPSAVTAPHEYDSMINEGHDRLKNGGTSIPAKKGTAAKKIKRKKTSSAKKKGIGPPVINELSNPVFQ